ncbi:MAG: zf-HC2 domain-containing protein [Candidatus Latescibacterota bacterium]|jgi:anti-sigma factor RsiW
MNCAACERHLSAYLDDELALETRLELEAHLDQCEACRGELEQHQAAWEAAQMAVTGRAPDRLWSAVEETLDNPGAEATTLESLALMIRGLAGEVQDLRREVRALRRAQEERVAVEETEGEEPIRVQQRRFVPGRPRLASIEQLRRTS